MTPAPTARPRHGRRAAVLVALATLVLAVAPPAPAQAPSPVPLPERDVWPDQALGNDEAAAAGRAAMPFTQEQIEALGRLLRQTQRAAARAGEPAPAPRLRRLSVSPSDSVVHTVRLARGYVTTIAFLDATGAPWPIRAVRTEASFLPPADARGGDGSGADDGSGAGDSGRHLLYLTPERPWQDGNAAVELDGLATPLPLALAAAPGAADFRLEIRLDRPGPNADRAALAAPPGFHAGDPALLALLAGTPPAAARALRVAGAGPDARAWRLGPHLLVSARAELLSPGPLAAERTPGGRWAYRLPATPHALVAIAGRVARMDFDDGEQRDGGEGEGHATPATAGDGGAAVPGLRGAGR